MQCGGSDAFFGVTANPAVGYASDLLRTLRRDRHVRRSTARCHSSSGTPRAINEAVGKRLLMKWPRHLCLPLDMGKPIAAR